jgi:hypothetical protein
MLECLEKWKWKRWVMGTLLSHRALYAGLCACHVWAAVVTLKPGAYGPMAVLYLLLAVRGN